MNDDDLDDDLDDPEPPDDPFPASPTTPPRASQVRSSDEASYGGRAILFSVLGLPAAFIVSAVLDSGSAISHEGLVVYLPWVGLCLAIALFITGGVLVSVRPDIRERGVHWAFLISGIVVFVAACIADMAIASPGSS